MLCQYLMLSEKFYHKFNS